MKVKLGLQGATLVMVVLGLGLGLWAAPAILAGAQLVSELFLNLLRLISLPMVFLSVISAGTRLAGMNSMRSLGLGVLRYTLASTLAAAVVALTFYLLLAPHEGFSSLSWAEDSGLPLAPQGSGDYWSFLRQAIPTHFLEPFLTGNVLGTLFLGLLLVAGTLALPPEQRLLLDGLFSALFALVLKIAGLFLYLMPLAVGSFVVLFVQDLRAGMDLTSLALYLACIVGANLVQALVVLPLFLASKGISARALAKAMWPALTVAFFSKSSAAAMPMAMQCAEKNAGMRPEVTRLSFPLCTTINMNACAAFILITVLFVSQLAGVQYSALDLLAWVLIASIAAAGNAAVPMGCYFLASSFLAAQNVPLTILGIILPIYNLIDMLETAINVWSDACVTAMVDKESGQIAEADSLSLSATGSI